jgi:diguanylate cyclase (GGDEF)-like protein
VLLLMSRLMRSSFRFDDRLYRFGGEEFVVLMRCADGEAAAHAFERLRGNVERHPFPQVGHITVSIGFTELKTGDTPNGAFERADKAVYFAKGHGRNQVRHHAELVASGHLADDAKIGDVELF